MQASKLQLALMSQIRDRIAACCALCYQSYEHKSQLLCPTMLCQLIPCKCRSQYCLLTLLVSYHVSLKSAYQLTCEQLATHHHLMNSSPLVEQCKDSFDIYSSFLSITFLPLCATATYENITEPDDNGCAWCAYMKGGPSPCPLAFSNWRK